MNYVVARVIYKGKPLLIDATSKYVPLGLLPKRASNHSAVVFYENSAKVVDVMNPNQRTSQGVANYAVNMNDECLEGSGQLKLKSYSAVNYRIRELSNDEKEDFEEVEGGDMSTDNVLEYTAKENLDDLDKDINIKYDERKYDEVNIVGEQVFIDALLDFGLDENPFYKEERDHPIFYSAPPQLYRMATIEMPEDYVVESLPSQVVMALEGERLVFKYSAKEVGSKVVLTFSLEVNDSIFMPMEYKGIKQIYDAMVEKSKEKIVLTKI